MVAFDNRVEQFSNWKFDNEARLDLFIALLLFIDLSGLFFEKGILLLSHQRIPQQPIFQEIASLERSLKHKTFMMSKYSSPIHSVAFPFSLVNISYFPLHTTLLMVGPFSERPLVFKLSRYCQLSLAVLAISIPLTLSHLEFTSYFDGFSDSEL